MIKVRKEKNLRLVVVVTTIYLTITSCNVRLI